MGTWPATLIAAVLLAGSAGTTAIAKTRSLTLVSYSVTRQVFARLVPIFCAEWEQERGERVRVFESYGSSGSQTRAVLDGLEADVVVLGLAPDVDRLVAAGLVGPDWRTRTETGGIVARSLIVLLTRRGNPHAIHDWGDLERTGIRIVQANPWSSGAARWVVLAAFCTGGEDRLRSIHRNAVAFDKDARDATHTFVRKMVGDVLPTWESDARMVERNGAAVEVVIPSSSIYAELPAAVVDAQVEAHGTRDLAEAFVHFLLSAPAQRVFAESDFRPIDPRIMREFEDRFPEPAVRGFFVDDFGGWGDMARILFNPDALLDRVRAESMAERGPTPDGR